MRPAKEMDRGAPTLRESKQLIDPLVARLRRTFAWYDELVLNTDYDADGDPQRLPYIDEHVLTQHYYEAHNPEFEDCQAYFTSGTSTGARKRILYSTEDHELYVEHRRKIFARILSPECTTACSDLGTGHAASSAVEIFNAFGIECCYIDFRRPAGEHVAILNKRKPDVFFTMPMVLDSLIQTGNLNCRPRKIITVGDIASTAWKKRIAGFFSLQREDLLDVFGSIEVGSIGYDCYDCGLYHFDDHIIPETVAPSELYEDFTGSGTAEILLVTSTARSLFPAIRYITNDLIEGFTSRVCRGAKRYSFERIVGRVGTDFKNGENISLYDVNEAINTFLPASPFEVRKESGKYIVLVASAHFTEEIGQRIRNFLKDLNPDSFQMIESSLVADIEVRNVATTELNTSAAKRMFLTRKTK